MVEPVCMYGTTVIRQHDNSHKPISEVNNVNLVNLVYTSTMFKIHARMNAENIVNEILKNNYLCLT